MWHMGINFQCCSLLADSSPHPYECDLCVTYDYSQSQHYASHDLWENYVISLVQLPVASHFDTHATHTLYGKMWLLATKTRAKLSSHPPFTRRQCCIHLGL